MRRFTSCAKPFRAAAAIHLDQAIVRWGRGGDPLSLRERVRGEGESRQDHLRCYDWSVQALTPCPSPSGRGDVAPGCPLPVGPTAVPSPPCDGRNDAVIAGQVARSFTRGDDVVVATAYLLRGIESLHRGAQRLVNADRLADRRLDFAVEPLAEMLAHQPQPQAGQRLPDRLGCSWGTGRSIEVESCGSWPAITSSNRRSPRRLAQRPDLVEAAGEGDQSVAAHAA